MIKALVRCDQKIYLVKSYSNKVIPLSFGYIVLATYSLPLILQCPAHRRLIFLYVEDSSFAWLISLCDRDLCHGYGLPDTYASQKLSNLGSYIILYHA